MKYMVYTQYFSFFVRNNHLTDKVKCIHSTRWFNACDSIWKSSPKSKESYGIKQTEKIEVFDNQIKNPTWNKNIDEQLQHNVDFNLVEPNEKDGAFHP